MSIKTWRERCETHPDHDGIVSDGMIRARMQEEIDELRDALKKARWVGLTDKEIKTAIQSNEEVDCSDHPDAPHGFDRDRSHTLGRYVCECEGWRPEGKP